MGITMTHDEIYEGRVARDERNYPVMTHDELLGNINSPNFWNSRTLETAYSALRAVVELHKPKTDEDGQLVCSSCLIGQDDKLDDYYFLYPCYTIQAIEKELK